MLISHSHQFIFFHVAKTGGSSVKNALEEYRSEIKKFKIPRPQRIIGNQLNPIYEMWESALWHAKARDAKKELPPEVYNQFYKFAFVRNPWDWQVSYYHFILKEPAHIRYQQVRAMSGFDEYLEWVIHARNPFPKGAAKLQKETITDQNNQIIVDFVGRYENLEQDFAIICKKLGIEKTLPHLNQSHSKDYRSFYNSRTQRLVAEHFEADIEMFGYDFERSAYSKPVFQASSVSS